MPAHLTRLVIRRILSNEPILYRGCLYRRANVHPQSRFQRPRRTDYIQTRALFGFSREPERKLKDADFAPGLDKMMDLNRALHERTQPPRVKALCSALARFAASKNGPLDSLSDIEAGHVLNTFRFVKENIGRPGHEDASLPDRGHMWALLCALASKKSPKSENHVNLAEEIFTHVKDTRLTEGNPRKTIRELIKTIEVFCLNDHPVRARDLLVELSAEDGDKTRTDYAYVKPWLTILEAFYAQGSESEAQETLQIMQDQGIPINAKIKSHLLQLRAERGEMEQTKRLFGEIMSETQGRGSPLSAAAYSAVLKCSLQHNEREWAQSIVRSMLEKLESYYAETVEPHVIPAKTIWDSLFLWAAASGKGVDEVDRMMNVMVRRTFTDGSSVQPDIATINQLVEWCMSRQEPYFAERYIALGLKWGVHPNATTYSLQIMYRLSGGDIDGARAAYKLLQAENCLDNEDIAAANKLIQAMASSSKYNFNTIMTLVDDLNERKARFEPETVSVLAAIHIQRNELHDVIDLLQTHTFHFSEEQRINIAQKFVSIILDRTHTSTTRAWDTYIITHSIFVELPRDARTTIMREFFARGRADMACHVFAHMRELQHPDTKATADTYVVALTGIAEYAMPRVSATDSDIDADERDTECSSLLDAVHNAMKLDLDVEPNTSLRNALILAYTACGQPTRAWSFWEDIVNSKEGPSYNSIPIAFRACERMTVGGEANAKALWARIKRMDIEVTKEMFAAYVGALAGNQNVDEAKEMVLRAEKEFGWRPDTFLLGTLFNAAYGVQRQEHIERWIQTKFPTQWVELKRLGVRKTEDGPRLFNIDRRLTP
ncbi:hypothetical protein B0J12DRAFT_330993 [Macrophomina phaseolina]|uniref:Uncharacterized protein n=1 Tax=Macrophomina phaseolina TaxID=35725 RepID=A0ABQ8GL56_9PEZI|nr:hypothetical protein B0J12DRAFT_330993 [Macrophomina phaseolina]